MKRTLKLLLAAVVAIASGAYISGYYLVYRALPCTSNTQVAASILAASHASLPATAASTSDARRMVVPSTHGPTMQHGQLQTTTIPSPILNGTRPAVIYLPPGYDATQRRYPVLYLLHGAPGSDGDWIKGAGIDQTMDALINVGRMPPMIVVLPNGTGGMLGDTQWANNGDGTVRIEDYLVRDVVPFVDGHYRTLTGAQHRAIGGVSTGGYGALNLVLHHPGLFGYVLSLSGYYTAQHTWTGTDLWASNQQAKTFNSPLLHAPHVPTITRLHIYLTTGAQDRNAVHEQQAFAAVLQRLGVPHRAQTFPGSHDWRFWRVHIVDALDYLAQVMPTP